MSIFAKLLSENSNILIFENFDLNKESTMGLKAIGNLFVAKNLNGLKDLLRIFNKEKINYRILGNGSNLILPEKTDTPYIKLDFSFDKNEFFKPKEEYHLPASILLNQLTSVAIKLGLLGWESFTGIPASVGGAVFMNAGTSLGEIASITKEVFYLDSNGDEHKHIVDKNSFSYRRNNFLKEGDIIYQVTLKHLGIDSDLGEKIKKYLQLRSKTQPLTKKTCGCVFKNYFSQDYENQIFHAGKFIDIIGLKGLTVGPLSISELHGNFVENNGGATYKDFLKLIEVVNKEFELHYGFKFEKEVQIFQDDFRSNFTS